MLRLSLLLGWVVGNNFYLNVGHHVACQYACSLLEGCASEEGSFCDEDGTCNKIKTTSEGTCYDCAGEAALSCEEAFQGYTAAMTNEGVEEYIPPNDNSNDEDWIFNLLPDWLNPRT
jgi:hypothetical protein